MDITLDQIDELRARAGVSYEEACNYLRAAGGDLIEAILMAERDREKSDRLSGSEIADRSRDVLERVRRVVSEGTKKRLVVKQEDRKVAEIPLAAGVIGAVLAPKLAVIGAVAALVSKSVVEIEDTADV